MELNNFKQEIVSLASINYILDRDFRLNLENKPNSYKFGDSSKWIYKGFSLGKALARIDAKEVTIEYLQKYNFMKDPYLSYWGDGLMGLSSNPNNPINFGAKEFAINPDSRYWQSVAFHELGHVFLSKGDSEADLFSYFCLDELNMPDDYKIPVVSRIAFSGDIQNKYIILDIQRKAKEFIALGRS